jgi:Transposase DDE domain
VRTTWVLQNQLQRSLVEVHKRRRDAVWRAVEGLIAGGRLWLTALGRSMPGRTSDKHRIKAADRLLGNQAIQEQLLLFYRALAKRLLTQTRSPVVAVDWTAHGTDYSVLSAQLCWEGRSLPLYNQVFPRRHVGSPRLHKQFLRELAAVIPNDCRPILVTDAGFRTPWFDAVAALGWDFIGRIRDTTKVLTSDGWISSKSLHRLATGKPRDFEWQWLPRYKPRPYRLVLSSAPKLKGRKRRTRSGNVGHNTTDIKSSSAAREPWLLATSLSCGCRAVLRAYGLRMQIEQSFRDAKNHRHGWALHHARSKDPKRLAVLLLIASLAAVVVQLVGRAAAQCGLRRHFQANTITHRRVLSFFVLGRNVLRRGLSLPLFSLLQAIEGMAELVAFNGWCFARE